MPTSFATTQLVLAGYGGSFSKSKGPSDLPSDWLPYL